MCNDCAGSTLPGKPGPACLGADDCTLVGVGKHGGCVVYLFMMSRGITVIHRMGLCRSQNRNSLISKEKEKTKILKTAVCQISQTPSTAGDNGKQMAGWMYCGTDGYKQLCVRS